MERGPWAIAGKLVAIKLAGRMEEILQAFAMPAAIRPIGPAGVQAKPSALGRARRRGASDAALA
jgi:hypothetical protein